MIHPDTTLRHVSDEIGSGVFATAPIRRGTITYVIDPLEIEFSPVRFSTIPEPFRSIADKYSFVDRRGYRIMSWDIAKYVNHHCEPSTISTGWGFEIAVRDIPPGEEITDEYGLLNLRSDFPCRCGSPRCRGVVRRTDVQAYHQQWDRLIIESLRHARLVDQPLWPYLNEGVRFDLEEYLATGRGYPSVLETTIDTDVSPGVPEPNVVQLREVAS